ncbi:MAG: hypothetical protein D6713_05045 [Deltaproteobacteria bacterium]|nr:MAG: hypothetical protein D6713_05045 [Deltaproteobacteria bacterium]
MRIDRVQKKRVLWKLLVWGVLSYGLFALVLVFTFRFPSSVNPDPHELLNRKERCGDCHIGPVSFVERSKYRVVKFRKDIYSLCTSCHSLEVHHPVDISPGIGFSGNLPLDPEGEMTCTTCHDPHGKPFSDSPSVGRSVGEKIFDLALPFLRKKYRTYFLREKNVEGRLCFQCHDREKIRSAPQTRYPDPRDYATSSFCRKCHPLQYNLWKISPHATMVRESGGDFLQRMTPLLREAGISPQEVVFVLGTHWVNRFVSLRGKDLVVRKPIYRIQTRAWDLSYWREFDWLSRCAGCHVTGLNPEKRKFAEKGIACEACHGPGKKHAATGDPSLIVNPAKLTGERRLMVCEACHTTGHDRTGQYRYPAGYLPGEDLGEYFTGLLPKPGQDDSTFKNDGSAEDRHRQFLFWLENYLFETRETCDLCKNFRFARKVKKRRDGRRYCTSCHGRSALLPPRCRKEDGPCFLCHPPAKSAEGNFSIHDHKFIPDKVYEEFHTLRKEASLR